MLAPNWQLMDCRHLRDPERVVPSWVDLAARALLPVGPNSPELIAPLMRHLPAAVLATVEQDEALLFALPVVEHRWPVPILANWITPLTISGLPHLDRHLAGSAITAFLRAADRPVLLRSVPADGCFWDALTASATHLAVLERWDRAGLNLSGTYRDWFERNFERKRRKEFRRLRSRLAERGKLESRCLKPGENTAPWIEALLNLENSGWKGRKGTALNSAAALATASVEAIAGLGGAGKLRFWQLVLDGRPIATMFAIVEGSEAWLGKIAYDEAFAAYSPGVLLVLDATENLFAESGIARADSCAIPGHPMIDRIWRDRIAMADVMVASSNIGTAYFQTACAAFRLHRRARNAARDLYYRITGKHRS